MSLYVTYAKSTKDRYAEALYLSGSPFWQKRRNGQVDTLGLACPKTLSVKDYQQLFFAASRSGEQQFEILFEDEKSEDSQTFSSFLDWLAEMLLSKDISVGLLVKKTSLIHDNEDLIERLGITSMMGRPPLENALSPHAPKKKSVLKKGDDSFITMESAAKPPKLHFVEGAFALSACLSAPQGLEAPFRDKLIGFINESGLTNAEVYHRAGISRQVFSNLLSNSDVIPSKSTVFCLIIGLSLNHKDAVSLLRVAGYAFSPSIRSDVIVEKYIKQGIYDLFLINSELDEYGCPPLGWHPREG